MHNSQSEHLLLFFSFRAVRKPWAHPAQTNILSASTWLMLKTTRRQHDTRCSHSSVIHIWCSKGIRATLRQICTADLMIRPWHIVWGNSVITSQRHNQICNSLKFFSYSLLISRVNYCGVIQQECEIGGQTQDSSDSTLALQDDVINQMSKSDEGAHKGKKHILLSSVAELLQDFYVHLKRDEILKQITTFTVNLLEIFVPSFIYLCCQRSLL